MFIKYGPHDNLDLMLTYGFALTENSDEQVEAIVEMGGGTTCARRASLKCRWDGAIDDAGLAVVRGMLCTERERQRLARAGGASSAGKGIKITTGADGFLI